ncbi:hypothetical protein Sez_1604 [Streptococcus equi subsp. zooepidemicus MGCS10565]|uniref:Uncharacterized protein n=1 Tax=Streptococcus equi subsp. zooepidemicus (strain MGCS10565) TaxID=552526 RepID=B4U4L8_STREM|nr:hypothetical protein Sez_1604 [Streptococcus equi subsp. zooepidemicus MGCS10565]AEJ25939.1 conserved hypothetical protein [Streptococcus equi subsp. zooepidemicus ATCC 35246]
MLADKAGACWQPFRRLVYSPPLLLVFGCDKGCLVEMIGIISLGLGRVILL